MLVHFLNCLHRTSQATEQACCSSNKFSSNWSNRHSFMERIMDKTCQICQKISYIIFSCSKYIAERGKRKSRVCSEMMAVLPLLKCPQLSPARVFVCCSALPGIPSAPVVRASMLGWLEGATFLFSKRSLSYIQRSVLLCGYFSQII